MKLRWLRRGIPVVMALIAWEGLVAFGLADRRLTPPPSSVAIALWSLVRSGALARDVAASCYRLAGGLGLGIVVGILAGLGTGRSRRLDSALSPLIQFVRPLPPVALIPLMIVWFGIGDGAKILAIALAVFFPVWISAHVGSSSVPVEYLWTAKLLSRSRILIMTRVIFPATAPVLVTGIRTAIPIAFVMVYVSELAGASAGLGFEIALSHLAYRIDEMLAALLVLGLAGAGTDAVFAAMMRRLLPWAHRQSDGTA